jgi:replicative DNA helicase
MEKPLDYTGLPADEGWEKFILCVALQHHNRLDELVGMVQPDDFSLERHRLIWAAMVEVQKQSLNPHAHIVGKLLIESGNIEAAGGLGYLADLATDWLNGPNVGDLRKYVDVLREYSVRRKAMYRANELLLMAAQNGCDVGELLRSSEAAITGLQAELKGDTDFVSPAQSIAAQGGLNSYASRSDSEDAISTHLPHLNFLIPAGGFRPGELIVLAAQTSRGKTAWALNLVEHATRHNKRVAVVSLEMDESSIYDRMIATSSEIDLYELRRSKRDPLADLERRDKIRVGAGYVASLPVGVCYVPGIKPSKLKTALLKEQAKQPIDLVIVDYIQLMASDAKLGTREQEVSAVTRTLKRIAGDMKIPVLALSQFSREHQKTNRRPELHDLRESGSIEQDANLVLFIHFTEMWDRDTPNGKADLIIAKQRNGALGTVKMNFHAPTGVFTEI